MENNKDTSGGGRRFVRRLVPVILICTLLFVTLTPAGITDNLSTLEAEILDFFGVSNRSAVPTAEQFDDATLVQKVNYLEDKLNQVFQSASSGKRLLATTLNINASNGVPTFTQLNTAIANAKQSSYNAGISAADSRVNTNSASYSSGVSAGYSNGFTAGKNSAASEAQNLSKIIFGQTYHKVNEVLYEAGKTYPVTTNIHYLGEYSDGWGNRVIRGIGIPSAYTTTHQRNGCFRMIDFIDMRCVFGCNYDGAARYYTYSPQLSGRIVDRTSGTVICSGNFRLEGGEGEGIFEWPAGWLCMMMFERNDFDYDGEWTYTTGSAEIETMLNNNNIVFECTKTIHVACYELRSAYY